MMGGSPGTHTTRYEKERVGVNKRKYGELADNGFKSDAEYNAATTAVQQGITDNTKLKDYGLQYDKTYEHYTLANGTDFEAAKVDFGNYMTERQEIADYTAKEERRKEAPSSLTGTSGKVDYTLGITQDDKENRDNLTTSLSTTIDTSPTISSTSQSLGIY